MSQFHLSIMWHRRALRKRKKGMHVTWTLQLIMILLAPIIWHPAHILGHSAKFNFSESSAGRIDISRNYCPYPKFQLNSSTFLFGGLFTLTSLNVGEPFPAGIQKLEAFKAAIQRVNTLGHPYNHTKFYYEIYDTQNTPSSCLAASMTLLRRNATVICGKRVSEWAC